MSNYKDNDTAKVSTMAALYNVMEVAQLALRRVAALEKAIGQGSGVAATKGWAPVLIDVDGDATLQKPEHLDCDLIVAGVGGCATVETVDIPEPDDTE